MRSRPFGAISARRSAKSNASGWPIWNDGAVVHALGRGEQAGRLLELPVGRERHPERVGLDGVRNLMKGHGHAPLLTGYQRHGFKSATSPFLIACKPLI